MFEIFRLVYLWPCIEGIIGRRYVVLILNSYFNPSYIED